MRVLNQSISPSASLSLDRHRAPKLDARSHLRTRATQRKALCQNIPGVGSFGTSQNYAFRLTTIKSISFDNAPCKPFRILLFQSTPLQTLWNLTLSQRGWGGSS